MGEVLEIAKHIATFDDFYRWYPRKIARKDAEKAWARLSADEKVRACEAILCHVAAWAEEGRDPKFIPHPSTWLNQGRFDDELEVSLPKLPACRWTNCDGVGKHQHGRASYCEKHIMNIKRGETPVGR